MSKRKWTNEELAKVLIECAVGNPAQVDVMQTARMVLDARAEIAALKSQVPDYATLASETGARLKSARLDAAIEALEWVQEQLPFSPALGYVAERIAELRAEREEV